MGLAGREKKRTCNSERLVRHSSTLERISLIVTIGRPAAGKHKPFKNTPFGVLANISFGEDDT